MKYKVGDRCKTTKNLLAPHCIGDIVTIKSCHTAKNGKSFYIIALEDGIIGYAMESCLELVTNEI